MRGYFLPEKKEEERGRGILSCQAQRDGGRPRICKRQYPARFFIFWLYHVREHEETSRRSCGHSLIPMKSGSENIHAGSDSLRGTNGGRGDVRSMSRACICFWSPPQNHGRAEVMTRGLQERLKCRFCERPECCHSLAIVVKGRSLRIMIHLYTFRFFHLTHVLKR